MKTQYTLSVLFLSTGLLLTGCGKVEDTYKAPVVPPTEVSNETSMPAPDSLQNDEEMVSYDGEYMLDGEGTVLGWTGKKIGGAHNGVVTVQSGDLNIVDGVGMGTFVIDMTSIQTLDLKGGAAQSMDDHLKNEDFFDVLNHPTATLQLKDVDVVTGGAIDVVADLTIKGITNEISFPATISQSGDAYMVNADFSIDRTLWDVRYGSGKFFSDIGDKAIDDMMDFDLDLSLSKK